MYDAQDIKQVGSRIRAIRLSKSMSQSDLATKASLSLPLISNIELGKKNMQLDTFVKIAEALQVSTDRLLRADVPEVRMIYLSELSDLLEDCSVSEMESILNIIRELKKTLHGKEK